MEQHWKKEQKESLWFKAQQGVQAEGQLLWLFRCDCGWLAGSARGTWRSDACSTCDQEYVLSGLTPYCCGRLRSGYRLLVGSAAEVPSRAAGHPQRAEDIEEVLGVAAAELGVLPEELDLADIEGSGVCLGQAAQVWRGGRRHLPQGLELMPSPHRLACLLRADLACPGLLPGARCRRARVRLLLQGHRAAFCDQHCGLGRAAAAEGKLVGTGTPGAACACPPCPPAQGAACLVANLQADSISPLPDISADSCLPHPHRFVNDRQRKAALVLEAAYELLAPALQAAGWQVEPSAQEIGQQRCLIAIPPDGAAPRRATLSEGLQLALEPAVQLAQLLPMLQLSSRAVGGTVTEALELVEAVAAGTSAMPVADAILLLKHAVTSTLEWLVPRAVERSIEAAGGSSMQREQPAERQLRRSSRAAAGQSAGASGSTGGGGSKKQPFNWKGPPHASFLQAVESLGGVETAKVGSAACVACRMLGPSFLTAAGACRSVLPPQPAEIFSKMEKFEGLDKSVVAGWVTRGAKKR